MIEDYQTRIANQQSVVPFSLSPYLCAGATADGICPVVIGNLATYYDGDHLTQPLVEALAPFFANRLKGLGVRYLSTSSNDAMQVEDPSINLQN